MKKGAKRTKRIGVEDTVLGVASARTTRNAAKRRPRMHHAPERRMNKGGQIRGLWWPATRIMKPKRTRQEHEHQNPQSFILYSGFIE
jgi:hypothetical protein